MITENKNIGKFLFELLVDAVKIKCYIFLKVCSNIKTSSNSVYSFSTNFLMVLVKSRKEATKNFLRYEEAYQELIII